MTEKEIIQEDKRSGYLNAFKTTALFGGVQFVTILLGIAKSKFVALWLGSAGYGIMSLFNSAIDLISYISNLGLQSSAVRDIANAQGKNNLLLVSQIVKAINRLVLYTGLLGAFITIAFAPWLSEWFFNSGIYTLSFVLLSSVVFLRGVYSANYSILQGTRNLTYLARANVSGAIIGFLCSLPMFYFFRQNGIVPAMILSTLSTFVVSYFFVRKVKLFNVKQTHKETFTLGYSTLKLGIMMSLGGISTSLMQFLIKTVLIRYGDLNEVGLYEAGWVLNETYLGLVFSAMTQDYFPRLSHDINNRLKTKSILNKQIEITLLILSPLIISMVVFLPFVIKLFYSDEFIGSVSMTKWMLIGSLIKGGSWGLSYLFLAKSDGKLYLLLEFGIKVINFPIYVLFYFWFGIVGLGYGFVFGYILYFILVSIVAWKKYRISYEFEFWKLIAVFLSSILLYPLIQTFWMTNYFIGVIFIVLISAYSLYELNKRINIRSIFDNIIQRK